jgi:hypothetical protein
VYGQHLGAVPSGLCRAVHTHCVTQPESEQLVTTNCSVAGDFCRPGSYAFSDSERVPLSLFLSLSLSISLPVSLSLTNTHRIPVSSHLNNSRTFDSRQSDVLTCSVVTCITNTRHDYVFSGIGPLKCSGGVGKNWHVICT